MPRFEIELPSELHPDSKQLLLNFAAAMGEKMMASQTKRGMDTNWQNPEWEEECQKDLLHHVQKGDPLDVGIYSAFCHHHDWSTTSEQTSEVKRSNLSLEFSQEIHRLEKLKLNNRIKLQLIEYNVRRFLIDYAKIQPFEYMFDESYPMAQAHLEVVSGSLSNVLASCPDRDSEYSEGTKTLDRLRKFRDNLRQNRIVDLDMYNGNNPSHLDNPQHPDMHKVQIQDLNATIGRLTAAINPKLPNNDRIIQVMEALGLYSSTLLKGEQDIYLAFLLNSYLQPVFKAVEESDTEVSPESLDKIVILRWFEQHLNSGYVPGGLEYVHEYSELIKKRAGAQ